MSIHRVTLSNGVRIVVEPIPYVRSAAIGLWCKTGSRHEHESEGGITHLIEHMLFKGTPTRTAKQIAEEVEGRGGSLNAFTDKEVTCYYCRALSDHVDNGIEVLSDMMRNSQIEPDELKREAQVVIEEIKRGEDEPGDHVHELHLEHRWGKHPLGKPIIGTRESVASFTQSDIRAYMDRQYTGGNVLLSVAGNVDVEQIVIQAEKWLSDIAPGAENPSVDRPHGTQAKNEIAKDVEQVHFCIGTDGVSIYDQDLYPMAVLDASLGGSMSSRLFQEIREKRGLAYSVGSYSLNYAAGGAFTVYGGTSPTNWEEVQQLVRAEFDKMMVSGLGEEELAKTKRQIAGHFVLSLESMSSRMTRNGRNELNHQREIPLEESLAKIEAVTNEDVRNLANRILDERLISTTAIGPF